MSSEIETIPILIAPHAVLRARAKPVEAHDPSIGDLSQVGKGLRMFVMDLQDDDRRTPYVLINPEIISCSKETATREEGCLSIPGQYADVTRPRHVRVRYTDLAGMGQEIEGEGLLSACLQHEIDHLDGVLFVDHISSLKRSIIMRRLAKEQRLKKGA